MESLKLLIPKGRIFDNVSKLFSDAGITITLNERTYRPTVSHEGFEMKVLKPQNVPKIIELGSHDCGFTGRDWVVESDSDVIEVMDLGFDKVRIVAACPEQLDEAALKRKRLVVATEYARLAEGWLKGRGYDYVLLRTYGATEVFPPDDADMIVDNTATGRTLKENGLRIVDTILESSTRFIASKQAMADSARRDRIMELKTLFEAVIAARDRVMLEMNVSKERFEELVCHIPCMRSPTVSELYGGSGYAIKIAVRRSELALLIPKLHRMGAQDIVQYDLKMVVP